MLSGAWASAFAQKATTITTLAVTSAGRVVTTVASGGVIALTASVRAGSTQVSRGQISFCDASATYCIDIHLLGTAQLTSAGTAVLKFRPGRGSHSYKAVFVGTNAYAGSLSAASALSVTGTIGPLATMTTIAESGSWGAYTLSATVTEAGGTVPPVGAVSFLDSSNGNSVLNTASLGLAVAGIGWPNPMSLSTSGGTRFVIVADFNGDGIPDLALNDNPLVIYLGNADGTYTEAPVPSAPEPTAGPMVVADFNGDGIPDLALAMYGSADISILLGKGDGTFAAAMEASVPGPHS